MIEPWKNDCKNRAVRVISDMFFTLFQVRRSTDQIKDEDMRPFVTHLQP